MTGFPRTRQRKIGNGSVELTATFLQRTVAAKTNGNFFEVLPANGWRTAVRRSSEETLEAILNAADFVVSSEERSSHLPADPPNVSYVELKEVANGLFLARSRG